VHMKRIIPCLDVREGRVVNGVDCVDIRDAGDPVELAARYDAESAGEVFIPFTAGGGLSSEEDVRMILTAGAEGAPAAG